MRRSESTYAPPLTGDMAYYLTTAPAAEPETRHSCGRCRTPYGRSTIPCPNDPANRPGWREVASGREKTTAMGADTETTIQRVTEAHRGNR